MTARSLRAILLAFGGLASATLVVISLFLARRAAAPDPAPAVRSAPTATAAWKTALSEMQSRPSWGIAVRIPDGDEVRQELGHGLARLVGAGFGDRKSSATLALQFVWVCVPAGVVAFGEVENAALLRPDGTKAAGGAIDFSDEVRAHEDLRVLVQSLSPDRAPWPADSPDIEAAIDAVESLDPDRFPDAYLTLLAEAGRLAPRFAERAAKADAAAHRFAALIAMSSARAPWSWDSWSRCAQLPFGIARATGHTCPEWQPIRYWDFDDGMGR